MKSLILSLLMALLLPAAAHAQTAPACHFELGFKQLHDAVPAAVGDCLADARYFVDGSQHSATQPTVNGMLEWVDDGLMSMTTFQANDNIQYSLVSYSDCVNNMGGRWLGAVCANNTVSVPDALVQQCVAWLQRLQRQGELLACLDNPVNYAPTT